MNQIERGFEAFRKEAGERIAQLERDLEVANNWVEHHQNHCDDLIKENAELRAELNEEAILNGNGSEREAALLGKLERLERENAALRSRCEELESERTQFSNRAARLSTVEHELEESRKAERLARVQLQAEREARK